MAKSFVYCHYKINKKNTGTDIRFYILSSLVFRLGKRAHQLIIRHTSLGTLNHKCYLVL